MRLPEFILGRIESTQQHEITMTFYFYKLLDSRLAQCFASIRMPNIS